MPEQVICRLKYIRMSPDPRACPSYRAHAYSLRSADHRAPIYHTFPYDEFVVFQLFLICFSTLSQVDQLNTNSGGFLSLPQVMNHAGRLPVKVHIVSCKPTCEHVVESYVELCGYEGIASVHKRKLSTKPVVAGSENIVNEVDYPSSIKEINPSSTAELIRFPAH